MTKQTKADLTRLFTGHHTRSHACALSLSHSLTHLTSTGTDNPPHVQLLKHREQEGSLNEGGTEHEGGAVGNSVRARPLPRWKHEHMHAHVHTHTHKSSTGPRKAGHPPSPLQGVCTKLPSGFLFQGHDVDSDAITQFPPK